MLAPQLWVFLVSGLARSAEVVMSANSFPGMKDVLCIWQAGRQRAYSKFLGNTATSIGTKPQQMVDSKLG